MNRRFFLVAIICIGSIIIPGFFGYPPVAATNHLPTSQIKNESFDPTLYQQIKSVDDLVNYIDKSYKGQKKTTDFLNYIASIISLRFYHGYSYYTNHDNWLAAVSGQLLWNDLSAIVLADDILKHPNAACSQQSIVLMECARRFGLDYRKVTFDHHFAVEIKVNNKWNYVDVNQEVVVKNKSLEDLINDKSFFPLYEEKLSQKNVHDVLANPKYGAINSDSANRAALFQTVSGLLSQYLILILFIAQIIFYYWQCKTNESIIARQ
jgi:hypothetical protein